MEHNEKLLSVLDEMLVYYFSQPIRFSPLHYSLEQLRKIREDMEDMKNIQKDTDD